MASAARHLADAMTSHGQAKAAVAFATAAAECLRARIIVPVFLQPDEDPTDMVASASFRGTLHRHRVSSVTRTDAVPSRSCLPTAGELRPGQVDECHGAGTARARASRSP